jgi:DNA-binding transcriptional LysR family regulator
MILNERVLRVVVTLAEELHFGHAAARLHLSQPALSATVKSLESDLGVRLFNRTSRSVELTEAGHVLVAEARRLIQENDRAVSLVRESSSDSLGPLHVGYPASMNLNWMGALIARAHRDEFLSARVRFISSEAVNLHEELSTRALHAAFFAGHPWHGEFPDLQHTTLFRESFRVVLPAAHPLMRSPLLRIDQLRDEPVVWLARNINPVLYDNFIALCRSQGYQPRVAQEARTFYECLAFARSGLGITFLPQFMESHAADESATFVPLPDGAPYVEYTLAWRRNAGNQALNRFIEFALAQIPGKTLTRANARLLHIDKRAQSF